MRRLHVCMAVPALLLLCFAKSASAQTDTSSLGGRVTDPQAAAVSAVQITLHNQATGAERKVVSDSNGEFTFTLIPAGRYDIEAAAPGFKTFHDAGFPVDVAAPAHLDISLQIGDVSDRVEVVADVSMLNTDTAAQGTVI